MAGGTVDTAGELGCWSNQAWGVGPELAIAPAASPGHGTVRYTIPLARVDPATSDAPKQLRRQYSPQAPIFGKHADIA